jgi:hypothetical protein
VVVEYASNPALAASAFAQALSEVNVAALFASGRRVIETYRQARVA